MSVKSAIIYLALVLSTFPNHSASGREYDWLLIYYMPYDNNLSSLSRNIIGQFLRADVSDNICVTLQVDLAGNGGMTRYVFNSETDSLSLDQEESASAKTLDDYLSWVSKSFKAKHYAVVLLNHGGGLNEYGLDDYPRANQWLQIEDLARSIAKFNKVAGISKIDLLFEQVCARGTVENLYEFNTVAKYTLASQDLVPAPGYYYPIVFSGLKQGDIDSGDELADLIVKSERGDMYYSYALIDNSKWNDWLKLLARHTEMLRLSKSGINEDEMKIVSYAGDLYFDFGSLVTATCGDKDTRLTGDSLKTFTNDMVIKRLYVNDRFDRMIGYSGISICSPFRITNGPLKIYSIQAYIDFTTSLRKIAKTK